MSRPTQTATRSPDPHFDGHTRETHPAYGSCRVSRWTASPGVRLYGSDLVHGSGITLHFTESSLSRGLSNDTHFAGDIILDVSMSHSQWAALVSGGHTHAGVPVTIECRRVGQFVSVPMIEPPTIPKKELYGVEMAEDVREKLAAIQAQIDALGKHLEAGGGKKELRAIHEGLSRAASHLPANLQFVYEQFAEATETVANQAKSEVDGYVNGVVHALGLKSLAELPRLENVGGGS